MNTQLSCSEDIAIIDDEELTSVPDSLSSFTVTESKPVRLDKFLADLCPDVSREKVKRSILEGLCEVNGQICTEPKRKVAQGETVSIRLAEQSSSLVPVSLPLHYIYIDADFVVVDKPAGLTVHPCPSCQETTLVQAVAADFPQLLSIGGQRPGIVHRLDKDTSGVMIVALTESCRLRLSEAFAERSVHKRYLALVHGVPAATGICTEPLGRHPKQKIKMAVVAGGRPAHTEWVRLYADPEGKFSLLEVRILTGRTHQIRVHMQHVGHPLLGDTLYCLPNRYTAVPNIARQMLHAWNLELPTELIQQQKVSGGAISRETPCSTGNALQTTEGKRSTKVSEESRYTAFYSPLPADFIEVARELTPSGMTVVLTGCPGCGKSAVLKHLKDKGCAVCSTDALVHGLYAKDSVLTRSMLRQFGKTLLNPETEEIDRKLLYKMMCEDDTVRQDVNRLVHPYVMENVDRFLHDPSIPLNAVRVVEIPLWFEYAMHHMTTKPDLTVGVYCADPVRHERLRTNRAWTDTTCKTMDSWQMAQDEKMRQSHIMIDNSASLEALTQNVETLFQRIIELQQKKAEDLESVLRQFASSPIVESD